MKTSKIILAALAVVLPLSANAQMPRTGIQFPEYQFTTVKANPITSIKNQASSGDCWSYSTISFVESEIIRINGIKDEAKYPCLAEHFVVAHSYSDRAEKFVRLDGNLTFGAGSEADDVLDVIRAYGIVPRSEFSGMNYGTELPAQSEVDAVLHSYVSAIAKNPNRTLTTAWKRGFDALVAEYFGKYPETFTVDGKTYTAESYRDALNFNPDDYVTLTSFTHHPFYTEFAIEVADNWRWDKAYNLPIDEFMQCLDNAIMNGYTAAWGSDVSEAGFNSREGVALLIDAAKMAAPGSDQARWTGEAGAAPKAPASIAEREATQESRQEGFDRKTITDDHGMHIYGIAKDQNGNKFYMVKNSWGETGKYKGVFYASENFVKNQSMDIMIHKSALPKDIAKKLGVSTK